MNLPNKITMGRIVIAIIVFILLLVPFEQLNVTFPSYVIAGKITVNLKYLIGGFLFLIASLTDFLDGNIARKRNLVTDFGKFMDAIADKVLVNGLLIILAYDGFIPVLVPVIIITRDIVVDCIRMVSSGKGKVIPAGWIGKVKTACMMSGITIVMFYNLPFELINIEVGQTLVLVATVLSIVSGCQYFYANKDFLLSNK